MGLISISESELRKRAAAQGLQLFTVTDLASFEGECQHLEDWQSKGYAGELQYMQRDPSLFAHLQHFLPEVRSVLSFVTHYDRRTPGRDRPPGFGRVARYAWGRDYHRVLKRALQNFVAECEKDYQVPIVSRIFSDAVPLLERAIALRAEAGFVGKNTMLIQPRGQGSFFFLSELLWNITVDRPKRSFEIVSSQSCGSCTRCQQACPTQAFASEYVLDARKCLSYLTIEKRTALHLWEREALGEWVFGCDVCQEVCPFNHQPIKDQRPPAIDTLGAEHGAGPFLNLKEVLSLRTPEAFSARFQGTALMRATRAGLLRNAAVVAANVISEECIPTLFECVQEDVAPLVRQHALWSLARLHERCAMVSTQKLEQTLNKLCNDVDQAVAEEARSLCSAGSGAIA